MRDLFDGDPFPFGIEENRPTLEVFLRYTTSRASPTATPSPRRFSRKASCRR
jgi:hypothetical protein